MAMNLARWRRPELDWRNLLPLAGATLLLLGDLFCAWQTWLIADQGRALARAHRAQDHAEMAGVEDEHRPGHGRTRLPRRVGRLGEGR